MLDFSYDFSDLFLENYEKDNRIQIENECMVKNHQKENNNEIQMEVKDYSEDYCSKEYDDDSEYEKEEDGLLKLNKGMKFET
ncbi:hypothetical protein GLOIN_2v1787879 [Rhizophagus irregularis DAOM 181602=DAOM 197198]|uniref:Uncharacterized protein n=1 Tax=Rhizophagus irregularis (strain DAOM 181602 / DAOM 197198 / MUCL 43194) TaxID=747089 RepID=A0A2P4P4W6_RHIID|nr:hypothetical protein GLOIN_2v1787879 [Rhizophagus irregularis DAOM 181602=DAOM 197198]POG60423.1 hypothetical protein GLOIN_2v1787879 [Rhizophagus irregularis DAOM 181602=DAOM 197198]GET64011.1 hypothetical protein GLOIN_2v1787879 [Rhizophagus irregularis DAOM 181602=DAOM 197198]|eukprot:XP_025167289.1 hypothetical protein GLOIN_2v1787879 [Rhizophagus irregularis DAOM 181602=DAOM 197198]